MALIQSFRELDVYKLARQQAQGVFIVTQSFPKEERYSLTDQIRRSSRAVSARARRKYKDAFTYKLYEALGETFETQSWLDHSLDCHYIDQEVFRRQDDDWQHVGAMLGRMIQSAESFCGPKGR